MQKRIINKIVKEYTRRYLSIQFSLDGFSFCISNLETKEIQNFGAFSFDKTIETPELLLLEIEKIVSDNSLFTQNFETVTIIHQNNLSTLVPTPLFKEEELKTYLEYNIKTLATDFIAFDTLSELEITNVYVPYVNINNFFFQQFGEFEYKHYATVLIDKLILHNKNVEDKTCFVHVSNNSFDIVVIENSKLIFHNSFTFTSKEDFIYYILFTAEQLQLNPEEFKLQFIGAIEKNSEIYKITYQYIRNVSFINLEIDFFTDEENLNNYSHYTTIP